MSVFKRGIENQNFINELNNSSYFQKMVDDKDLFIAIRNEYINVYYYGQNISKITFSKRQNKIKWEVHKKYIGKKNERGYEVIPDNYLENVTKLKENICRFIGKEKRQVKKHILNDSTRCIIDVEVGFGIERAYIDYVAIEKTSEDEKMLVFYEAKHFDNSEIRATTEPKVFAQMKKYEEVLDINRSEILSSYKTIFKNIYDLGLSSNDNFAQMTSETSDDIKINTKPRLIIFEVDQQRKGDLNHIKKLQQAFGERLEMYDLEGNSVHI